MSQLPTSQELNITRGKALVDAASKEEVLRIFEMLDAMEMLLDEMDCEDAFGTEGWRHRLGVED